MIKGILPVWFWSWVCSWKGHDTHSYMHRDGSIKTSCFRCPWTMTYEPKDRLKGLRQSQFHKMMKQNDIRPETESEQK